MKIFIYLKNEEIVSYYSSIYSLPIFGINAFIREGLCAEGLTEKGAFTWSDTSVKENVGLPEGGGGGGGGGGRLYTNLSILSHKLVYNGGFQTLNCCYWFGIQPMWPKFCAALVTRYDLSSQQICV